MSAEDKPGWAAPIAVGRYEPPKPGYRFGGFFPDGHYRLDRVSKKAGGDQLGRWLASGVVIAALQTPNGLADLPPSFWQTAEGEDFMSAAVEAEEDEPCPISVRGASPHWKAILSDLMEPPKPLEAATAPPPAMTAADETRARQTFESIVEDAVRRGQRLTLRDAYNRVKAANPNQSWRNFHDKIWPAIAPEHWQKAGRPPTPKS